MVINNRRMKKSAIKDGIIDLKIVEMQTAPSWLFVVISQKNSLLQAIIADFFFRTKVEVG
jgi:hypothetical protein